MFRRPPRSPPFPYTTLFRSLGQAGGGPAADGEDHVGPSRRRCRPGPLGHVDRDVHDHVVLRYHDVVMHVPVDVAERARAAATAAGADVILAIGGGAATGLAKRSEERRVGEGGRSRWSPEHLK